MKYVVYGESISYVHLEVEADSYEEAMEIARESDGGEWDADHGEGDWIYSNIVQVDDNGAYIESKMVTRKGYLYEGQEVV